MLVPWGRVFIGRDITVLLKQFFDTGAHVLVNRQAQPRFSVKLQFIASVVRKITAMNGTEKIPGVQEKLGEITAGIAGVESALLAVEYTATPRPRA